MTSSDITMETNTKHVANQADLVELIERLRADGGTIALTNGCYDLLHVGHLRSLEDAKGIADVLIVALNSDDSVGQWKGPGYPVVPERERAEMIAGFACVDHVYVFSDPSVDRLLEVIRPDAYCKGPEYTMENLPEADTVRKLGIRFCTVGDPKGHSSTNIVQRVVEACARRPKDEGRNQRPSRSDVNREKRVEILSRRRRFDGFLNLDEVHLRHELPDGQMSPEIMRLNIERGDGAAVLVVNTDRDSLLLTRQFRFAAWERGTGGWMLEIPAGTVAADGDAAAVARSEVAEEVGYAVQELKYLMTFFASPGTTSERVILYEASVTDADRLSDGGGLADEHEYIEVVEMPVSEAIARMKAGEIIDAKSVIALQTLSAQRGC